MSESLKQKTAKGVLWSAIEQFSVQIIQFVLGLIMARILSPHDYGLVGMILVFTAMGVVVFLSVMFISSNIVKLVVGVVVGAIFYFSVARLFKMEELSDLLSLVKRKK